ncbi:MAG: hypothetical protein J3R72DRAFT_421807 [Linnemannia gamsii]|nr:MAG: hypothetical protein J3R72DRAFT_421807 [Linnemannia gamsii]
MDYSVLTGGGEGTSASSSFILLRKFGVKLTTAINKPFLTEPVDIDMTGSRRVPLFVTNSLKTTDLPMAPVIPVPLQQQHQTMGEQIKGYQFSTHPHPNFVNTTLDEPEPPNVSTSPLDPHTGALATGQVP